MPAALLLLALALAGPPAAAPAPAPGRAPVLAVHAGGEWRTWWRADRAPTRWAAAHPLLAAAVAWRPLAAGLEAGELRLSGDAEAWRIRVVLARFAPEAVDLRLAYTPDRLNRPDRWSVEDAPVDALLALNAGQFTPAGPWGWMVQDGVELRPPGSGPLAPAVVADDGGALRFVAPDSIAAVRARGGIRTAFQSYPAVLLDDGAVPAALRTEGSGVNLTHRDSRLALCELRDGRWLVALTRFEGLGGALERLPFGLTTPEMAALMGGLGCRRAVLLDGGLSGQLLLRDAAGEATAWAGLRRVPAGLVALPR
ncbi:MAG TPA: phosphodiester glycosidase family protein [Gemmatimonadales bacterium]|nr:phosphodiester glycosidase family protein [Gemmatimonadales bacterium]